MNNTAILIFPHQLFEQNPLIEKNGIYFLIEEPLFFSQYKFHVQKLIMHRSSMKFYYDFLSYLNNYFYQDFFEDKKEAIYFDSNEDLSEKIEYYSKNNQERSNIAMNGKLKYFDLFENVLVTKYMIEKYLNLELTSKTTILVSTASGIWI